MALLKSARQDSNPQHTSSVPSNTRVVLSLVDLNKLSDLKIAMAVCPHRSHGWRVDLTAVPSHGWENGYLINDFWLTALRKLQETDGLSSSGSATNLRTHHPTPPVQRACSNVSPTNLIPRSRINTNNYTFQRQCQF